MPHALAKNSEPRHGKAEHLLPLLLVNLCKASQGLGGRASSRWPPDGELLRCGPEHGGGGSDCSHVSQWKMDKLADGLMQRSPQKHLGLKMRLRSGQQKRRV